MKKSQLDAGSYVATCCSDIFSANATYLQRLHELRRSKRGSSFRQQRRTQLPRIREFFVVVLSCFHAIPCRAVATCTTPKVRVACSNIQTVGTTTTTATATGVASERFARSSAICNYNKLMCRCTCTASYYNDFTATTGPVPVTAGNCKATWFACDFSSRVRVCVCADSVFFFDLFSV